MSKEIKKCHDCNCKEGELHIYGCDMERCPFCSYQLITCDCIYKFLGYEIYNDHPTYGLPVDIFENGLSDEEFDLFENILKIENKVPYIRYPIICCYCGELWPEFFSVSDTEWKKYIQLDMRNEVLCIKCYDSIKKLIEGK